ncbi:hypothetical protein FS749_006246 [Ceratobasidium sp. UAMH 11750]|nr:hypothetical protein FS749_006246 [Ceratobasidium sp. UAMH 11750]
MQAVLVRGDKYTQDRGALGNSMIDARIAQVKVISLATPQPSSPCLRGLHDFGVVTGDDPAEQYTDTSSMNNQKLARNPE